MTKPKRSHWSELAAFIDAAGMVYKWDDLTALKHRADACYVVAVWDRGNGTLGLCDLTAPRPEGPWEFQNDSEECTEKQWRGLRIVPECDWCNMPEEDSE